MQQRSAYAPATPNFTVSSPDSPHAPLPEPISLPFLGSARSSSSSSRISPRDASPARGSATSTAPDGLGMNGTTVEGAGPANGSAHDYFSGSMSEKYPPARSNGHLDLGMSTGSAGTSSVHLPLLGGDSLDDDDLDHLSSKRSRGGSGPKGILANLLVMNTRARLHPLALVPTFVFGIMFAMSGVLGPTFKAAGASGRSVMTSLISPFTHAPLSGPNYTMHSSGHLFVLPSALHPSSDSSPFSAYEAARLPPHSMRHPIHDLIANATREWEAKLARQSKTLEEAVREYKRRFRRPPPRGFDDWFRFAQQNDVVLIDEFDQTFTDILPFYAMPPSIISERAELLQVDPSTFTMVIKNGKVEIVGAHKGDGRAKDQAELMQRWTKWVPDVNITMSAHDGPSIMMDWKAKTRYAEAAQKGTYLSRDELDEVDEDPALWGFPLACPPNSRLRRAYDGLEIGNLPTGPSFVADHLQTMNLCENPEWQYLHGFTSWPGMRPQTLRPLFSFAKTPLHSDILLTPLEQYWDHEPYDPKWEDKPHNKAVWRGSTTGVWFDRGTWWRSSQRVRLWFMGKDRTGHRRVRFSGEGLETPEGVESLVEKNVSTMALMNRYVDFAFTGKEGQCDEEDGSCDAVRQLFDFQRTFGWNEANEYKYLLDLDGNAWSGRFHRLLSSNSVVLKSTVFPEWYAGWIQPWVHYVPIKVDYTDLFDTMAFFAGDLDGRNGHEDLAKQIADNGKDYTARFWRYADMEAYFFRLSLEWARVTSPDRSAMDYHGPGS
ncbi:hypothetical protein JCM5296_004041 [Sporobolomyces johnsonii]